MDEKDAGLWEFRNLKTGTLLYFSFSLGRSQCSHKNGRTVV